jgi:hypothetical protein
MAAASQSIEGAPIYGGPTMSKGRRASFMGIAVCSATIFVVALAPLLAGQGGPEGLLSHGAIQGKVASISVNVEGAFVFRVGDSAPLPVDPTERQAEVMRRLVVLAAEKDWSVRVDLDSSSRFVRAIGVDAPAPSSGRVVHTTSSPVLAEPTDLEPLPPSVPVQTTVVPAVK